MATHPHTLRLTAVAIWLVTAACGHAPATPLVLAAPDTRDADVRAIREVEDQWNRDFEAKDAALLAAHYAEDAVLISSGGPPARGKQAIQASLADSLADPAFSLRFHASQIEVSKSGDLAVSHGKYTMTTTNTPNHQAFNDKGSYVTVYRKQSTGWKAIEDISTSELPLAAN